MLALYLTILLMVLFAVYAYRDIWPLLTFAEQPMDSCKGPFLWGKVTGLTVGAVVYPLFSPRLYIPLDAKVATPASALFAKLDFLAIVRFRTPPACLPRVDSILGPFVLL